MGQHSNRFCPGALRLAHRLRTPSEEIAYTAQPKIKSQSQIFRYSRSIFCLPHQPKISDFFDSCLHWVSVVRGLATIKSIRDHSFRTSANFTQFLTPPTTTTHTKKGLITKKQMPISEIGNEDNPPPKNCGHSKWMVPYTKPKLFLPEGILISCQPRLKKTSYMTWDTWRLVQN